ncbi:PREDICTED: protein CUP-SHAPED COTYLEDON 3-like [Fragaria vesca subsp. vesca]|uniref:protein CUP-SHAPED COTYLEDON 3-like n=1 Tax=Fragaria vesca subsp. vesca TaxID=101020 RepID=UPI0002C367CE|nr:PREDICTED: protein CUP-SHAPED COTYLEDON 3-like [Fragaria vesca subsp. vesca]
MGLRDIGATLPPGFRFYPSDEELVCHYLYKKVTNEEALKGTLVEIDLHTCEPWQLPEVAKLNANEWYFFSFRDRKYATGFRTNRATTTGYWKATGKDRMVVDPGTGEIVGMRKTLVFYRNRAPNGIKTGWIMHEFRLETPHMPPKEDWVLCRVFHKGKGEMNSNMSLSPHDLMLESNKSCTVTLTSPPSHHEQNMHCGYSNQITSFSTTPVPHQSHSHSHNNQSSSLLNLLQLSQEKLTDSVTEISAKNDDDYGFLWDMNLEESSFENGTLDDMRFEMENSMVLL